MGIKKRICDSNDIRVNCYGDHAFFVRYKKDTRKVYGWNNFVNALREQFTEIGKLENGEKK